MVDDWHQLLQSIIIGLIFSFLLAKLISILTTFRNDNFSITRNRSTQSEPESAAADGTHSVEDSSEVGSRFSDDNSVLAEKGSAYGGDSVFDNDVGTDIDDHDDDDVDDDDDWEGVECTELDEAFSAATAFVAASVSTQKVSNVVQLQLYGLYKIATEGPCGVAAPPAFKMRARAKWNAWQKLGAMPPEEAMEQYVDIVTGLFPSWASGGDDKRNVGDHSSDSKAPMGPVFSSLIHEEGSGIELKMDEIHAFAREGEVDSLLKCIESGVSVDLKDSEGRTPLHWAVDRGHSGVIELLCSKSADMNAKDHEGQTPLHYAVVCDREAIAEYLVNHNADTNVKDDAGISAADLCEKNWSFLQTKNVVE